MRVRWVCFWSWVLVMSAIAICSYLSFEETVAPPARFVIYTVRDAAGKDHDYVVDFHAMQQFVDGLGGPKITPNQLRLSLTEVDQPWYVRVFDFDGMTTATGIDLKLGDIKLSEFDQIRLYHELVHYAYLNQPGSALGRYAMMWFIMPAVFFFWLVPRILALPVYKNRQRIGRALEVVFLGFICFWVSYFLNPEELLAYLHSNYIWGNGAPPLIVDGLLTGQLPSVTKSGELAWTAFEPTQQLRYLIGAWPILWYPNYMLSYLLFWLMGYWLIVILRRKRQMSRSWYVRSLWIMIGLLTLYSFRGYWYEKGLQLIEYRLADSLPKRPLYTRYRLAEREWVVNLATGKVFRFIPSDTPPKPLPAVCPLHVESTLFFDEKKRRKLMLAVTLTNLKQTPLVGTLEIHFPKVAEYTIGQMTVQRLTGQMSRLKKGHLLHKTTWQLRPLDRVTIVLNIRLNKESIQLWNDLYNLKIGVRVKGKSYRVDSRMNVTGY